MKSVSYHGQGGYPEKENSDSQGCSHKVTVVKKLINNS